METIRNAAAKKPQSQFPDADYCSPERERDGGRAGDFGNSERETEFMCFALNRAA
jgi:hypothetical protein